MDFEGEGCGEICVRIGHECLVCGALKPQLAFFHEVLLTDGINYPVKSVGEKSSFNDLIIYECFFKKC